MDTLSAELCAIHEAGHSVVALTFGRQVHRINIESRLDGVPSESGRRHGACAREPAADSFDELTILWGGMVASGLAGFGVDGGSGDIKKARIHAKYLLLDGTESELDLLNEFAARRARAILKKHWSAVETIARLLLRDAVVPGTVASKIHKEAVERYFNEQLNNRTRRPTSRRAANKRGGTVHAGASRSARRRRK